MAKRMRLKRHLKYVIVHKFLKIAYDLAEYGGWKSIKQKILAHRQYSRLLFGDIVVFINPADVRNLKDDALRSFKKKNPFIYDQDTLAAQSACPAAGDHPAMTEIFLEGKKYEDTADYSEAVEAIEKGQRISKGLKSVEDLKRYYDDLNSLYSLFKRVGYEPQRELGLKTPFEEIEVFIDEKGGLVKIWGNGTHRFALVRILGLRSVPVKIVGVHKKWLDECRKEHSRSDLYGFFMGLRSNKAILDIYYTEKGLRPSADGRMLKGVKYDNYD